MADFVASADRIAAVGHGLVHATAGDWAELLAGRRLRITSCVDTSVEVANFLDDPGFAGEVDRLVDRFGFSELTRRHLLSNHNIVRALRRGLMRYVILAAHHEPASRPETLRAANEALLRNPAARHAAAAGPAPEVGLVRGSGRVAPPTGGAGGRDPRGELDGLAAAARALDAMARRFVRADQARDADPGRALAPAACPSPARRHRRARRRAGPTALPEATLLLRCGPQLRAVLEGRVDPLELLFPGGDGRPPWRSTRLAVQPGRPMPSPPRPSSELLAERGPPG